MVTEHERVMRFGNQPEGVVDPKIRIINMHKVFPAAGGAPEKVAVKCVSLGVNERVCLGLLGHNGAGKTTMLNMLTGLFPPTSGSAYVDDLALTTDIDKIYARMGVCPQHDILWNDLNARTHLRFFGRLKGYSGKTLARMVKKALIDVNLLEDGLRRTGGFSGGMKRRLSVANSLVGDPQVVYMEYVLLLFKCLPCTSTTSFSHTFLPTFS